MDKNAPLQTPIRRYVKRLTKTAERLRAQNSILTQQNRELQDIIRARREHRKGRQVVLEGQIVLTTKELTEAVIDIDNRAVFSIGFRFRLIEPFHRQKDRSTEVFNATWSDRSFWR